MLESLALLVGAPLLVVLVVYAVAKIDTTLQAKRGDAPPTVADSVWVGGRQAGGEIEAAPELHGAGPDDTQSSPGGAGARW